MPDPKDRALREFESVLLSLERKRKSRIYALIHTSAPYHICRPSLWELASERDKFRRIDTLEILVHSPGGHVDIAYQLAKFFRAHCKRLNVLVPLYAKSSATRSKRRRYGGVSSALGYSASLAKCQQQRPSQTSRSRKERERQVRKLLSLLRTLTPAQRARRLREISRSA